MPDRTFADTPPLVLDSGINIPYHWWAGDTASRFLTALRDERQILATRCASCGRTYVPPRKNCPVCFGGDLEWVTAGPAGDLLSYTVARRQLAALSGKVPVIFGLVRLDGADTAMLHTIGRVEPEQVCIGMRLNARFREERTGSIQDIECFEPV